MRKSRPLRIEGVQIDNALRQLVQPRDRRMEAAEEQRRADRADDNHVRVLAQEERRELHGRVFGVIPGDQFRFGFRQVKRRAVRLRQHGDHVNQRRDQAQREELEDVPGGKRDAVMGQCRADLVKALLLDDLLQAQAAGQQHDRDNRQAHAQFIGNHLRRRPQAAEQRILVVGRPARQHDAIDRQRTPGQHIQNADIDVRRDRPPGVARPPGNDGGGHQRGNQKHDRREDEQDLVHIGRVHVLFEQQLQAVRDGLEAGRTARRGSAPAAAASSRAGAAPTRPAAARPAGWRRRRSGRARRRA